MTLSNYLNERKAALKDSNRKVLVMTHVVCGYPDFDANWQALEVMQEYGFDLVELQFPFSEPSADGPTFVKANQQAIANGVSVSDCFEFMTKVNEHFDFKTVMMGYYNTVFKTGYQRFLDRLKDAGASGFILPDLPIDEAGALFDYARHLELSPIVLMPPTNTDSRLQQIAERASGFIYTVARRGVTGSSTQMDDEVASFISRCRAKTDLPLAIGFGVNSPEDVAFISRHAEIAVIGTAALQAWEEGGRDGLEQFFGRVFA